MILYTTMPQEIVFAGQAENSNLKQIDLNGVPLLVEMNGEEARVVQVLSTKGNPEENRSRKKAAFSLFLHFLTRSKVMEHGKKKTKINKETKTRKKTDPS